MKAILVMDMPSSCLQCEFSIDDDFTCFCIVNSMECSTVKRPDWCPLKPMPEKMQVCGKYPQPDGIVPSYKIGYNACIDEILGDKE